MAATFTNSWLIEKTGGTGVSAIAADVVNSHVMESLSGTLDLQGAVSGTGTDQIFANSALQFDSTVGSGQTVSFKGSNATLDLTDWGGFSGAIFGFDLAGASNDMIDVAAPWTYVGFTQSTGMMTFADGATQHSVHLAGNYLASNFHANVIGGATQVTYG